MRSTPRRACWSIPTANATTPTIALSQWVPSPDGKLLAYALSDGGTDWNTWHFRRVADGTDLPVILKFSKFWPVSWARDSSGVYYSRYPLKPGQKAEDAERGDDAGRPDVYFHKLGEPQSADRLVYQVTDHPTRVPVGAGHRRRAISRHRSVRRLRVQRRAVQDLRKPDAKPQPLFTAWDALYTFIGSKGDELYFQTTNSAPRGRVIAVECRRSCARRAGAPSCRRRHRRSAASSYIGGRVVVEYTRDARSVVRLFEANGARARRSETSRARHRHGFQGSGTNPETFFSYSDYLSPTRILRLDVAANTVSEFRTPKVPADFTPLRHRAGVLPTARTARACPCSSRAARMRRATAIGR